MDGPGAGLFQAGGEVGLETERVEASAGQGARLAGWPMESRSSPVLSSSSRSPDSTWRRENAIGGATAARGVQPSWRRR